MTGRKPLYLVPRAHEVDPRTEEKVRQLERSLRWRVRFWKVKRALGKLFG